MQAPHTPFAERVRPERLSDLMGQEHLLGPNGVLQKVLSHGRLGSTILWGPPGVGKTSIARVIAQEVKRPFQTLSAISSGVKDVREVISRAATRPGTILFIDEIHRFNKSQQDALLGAVEKGVITLIGATTENPSFEVNAALLSRCQVYTLRPLSEQTLLELLSQSIERDAYFREWEVELKETDALLRLSGGDARRLLNLFEQVANAQDQEGKLVLTDELAVQAAQQKAARYDKSGEQHYDIVSAFIKSMRGSDPNAAVYWMTRMLEGGEDPKFIARRMLILASEDIGLANPTALVMANNGFQAVNVAGMPEAGIILSQVAVYLATSPKSNASYMAYRKAQQEVKQSGDQPVPLSLRNAPTKLMKQQGYGKEYKYSHSYPNNFAPQEFLPEALSGTAFYQPGNNPREQDLRKRLQTLWQEKYGY